MKKKGKEKDWGIPLVIYGILRGLGTQPESLKEVGRKWLMKMVRRLTS